MLPASASRLPPAPPAVRERNGIAFSRSSVSVAWPVAAVLWLPTALEVEATTNRLTMATMPTMSTTIVKGERGHLSDVFRINLETGAVRRVTVDADGTDIVFRAAETGVLVA